MCPVRIMMTPSIISSYFSDSGCSSMSWGWKTIDVLYNTKYTISNVTKFFKQFSNLPSKFYDDLQNKIINLKPKDSLEYGLVNQVVNFRKITPLTVKNIEDYYDIESLTANYKNIKKTDKKKKQKNSKKHLKAK